MIEALLAILCGLLLIASLISGRARRYVEVLRPWQSVLGVVALVVGVLSIASVIGIALIIAGLALAADALTAVPAIGDDLRRAGKKLTQFNPIIGIVLLVIGVVTLLG